MPRGEAGDSAQVGVNVVVRHRTSITEANALTHVGP
jgi:hypothetical protein